MVSCSVWYRYLALGGGSIVVIVLVSSNTGDLTISGVEFDTIHVMNLGSFECYRIGWAFG